MDQEALKSVQRVRGSDQPDTMATNLSAKKGKW